MTTNGLKRNGVSQLGEWLFSGKQIRRQQTTVCCRAKDLESCCLASAARQTKPAVLSCTRSGTTRFSCATCGPIDSVAGTVSHAPVVSIAASCAGLVLKSVGRSMCCVSCCRSTKLQGAAGDSKPSDWTSDEDELLRSAVFQYGGKKWKTISTSLLGRRSPTQCNARWNELQNLYNAVKSPWSSSEDGRMMELVGIYGPGRWAVIASYLPGRNGKQCRERWHNQLNPAIKKDSWAPEEDRQIIELQAKLGNAWAKIADQLSGRTDNAVKNRWHSSLLKSNTSRVTRSRRQPRKRSGGGDSSGAGENSSNNTRTTADAKKKKKKTTSRSKACDPDSSNEVSSPTAVDANLQELSETKFSCPPPPAPPLSPPPPTLLVAAGEEQPQNASMEMSIKMECDEHQSFHDLLASQLFGMEPEEEEESQDDPSQPSFEAVATPDASSSPFSMMMKMFSSGTESSDVDVDITSCESLTFAHCGGDGIPSLVAEDPSPSFCVVKDEFPGSKISDLQLLPMQMQTQMQPDEEDQLLYHSVWRGDPVATGTSDPVVVNMAPLLGVCKEDPPSSCASDAFALSMSAGGPFASASDTSMLFSGGGFSSFPMPRDDELDVSLPSYCGEDILL